MLILRPIVAMRDASERLFVIEKRWQNPVKSNKNCYWFVYAEPIAVVIIGPAGVLGLDMHAKRIDVGRFRPEIPELDLLLASQ